MGVLEIISGVLLILCSIAIIVMVLFQESKGNGLSGAIAGGEMMGNEGRSRSSMPCLPNTPSMRPSCSLCSLSWWASSASMLK